ncbi:hypothetical protein ABBQ38_001904 [Trebouxia sp. C0009 RCD-2024]
MLTVCAHLLLPWFALHALPFVLQARAHTLKRHNASGLDSDPVPMISSREELGTPQSDGHVGMRQMVGV